VLLALVTLALLAVAYVLARAADVPFSTLSRDAAATLDAPWYVASVSNLGVLALVSGAAVALFTAVTLRSGDIRRLRWLLGSMGALVTVVALDDLLMIHELAPEWLGVEGTFVMAAYGVLMLAILIGFRGLILRETPYGILLLAGLFLALSASLDVIGESDIFELPFSGFVVEDPAKIAGYVLVAGYLMVVSRMTIGRFASGDATSNRLRDLEPSNVD
jgi:hypothetical protein